MTVFSSFIAALSARDTLEDRERDLIESLPSRAGRYRRGEELVAEGSRPTESCLITSGMAARTIYLMEGQRQITAIHVPGDFVDLHSLYLKTMDHSVAALGACTAVFVPHPDIVRITAESPHLARLFSLTLALDAAIQRAWITSLGRRGAAAHLAHLLCELFYRFRVVGLTAGSSFDLAVTQSELADVMGLSTVHTNRAVKQLRATGLVGWVGSRVTIHDLGSLAAMSDFDPLYLNLRKEHR